MQILRLGAIFLGEFTAAIRLESDEFFVQHIHHLIETGADVHWHRERHHFFAEVLAQAGQCRVKIHVFLVQPIHSDEMRHAKFARPIPHLGGAHLHAVGGVDDHQCRVAHAQGPQSLGHKIKVAGRVDEIQLLAAKLHAQRRGVDGNLPFLFRIVIIAHRRAGLDAAQPVDGARGGLDAFGQHRLARRCVAHDGEITNVF